MRYRGTPKLDAARAAVRAVLARAEAAGWPLARLRGELRAARECVDVGQTTWRTAVVLLTGRGLRKLQDPRRATLAAMSRSLPAPSQAADEGRQWIGARA